MKDSPTSDPALRAATMGETETAGKPVGLTIRSIIVGFIIIVPAVFWGVYADVVSQTDLTSTSLMMPPILALLVLVIANASIGKKFPRLKFTQREMITVYIMVSVSVVLSGMGLLQFLSTTIGAVPHFMTPENKWQDFLNYVPKWLLPQPNSVLDGFYKGDSPIPWYAWWRPCLIWSGFFFALVFCMLCINVIIRKQWMDRERLTFPIVYLPLEMTDPKSGFFRNRLMWTGFAIAAGLELMNGLNYIYPSVPHVQLRAYNISPFFAVNKPWNAVGSVWTTFYPLAIGLGFLLSTDVSFSCWFFFLLTKVQSIITVASGWTAGPAAVSQPPYLAQQGAGAFFGIVIMVVWLARKHLKDVVLKAFTKAPEIDDSGEPLGYRTATFGLLLALAL